MKKIALILAFIMLLGGCLCFASCDSKDDSGTPSAKEEAQDCVKYQLMAELALSKLNGADISFTSCTYGTTKDLGDNNFKISGTVKVRDEFGNFHVANYSAEVEYDEADDDYDAEVSIGSFKKQ